MKRTLTFDRCIDTKTGKPPLALVVEADAEFFERLDAIGKAAFAEGEALRKAFGEANQ